ncbi:MAG: DNA repair protein RecO [Bacilli bacterium]|jgi:DNA repair protein RecO (recombination protein O)|nr:DNA repair protein RecO [Bacilli bacterium]
MRNENKLFKGINGIIINIVEYKDNDLIVTFLTRELGFIQTIVKGAQKKGNKSFYLISLFNELTFDVVNYQKNELSIFKSGDIINACDYTTLSLDNLNMMMLISEILYKMRNSDIVDNKDFFKLVKYVMRIIVDNNNDSWYYLNYLLLVVLNKLGVSLVLDRCIICSKQEKIVAFSNHELGFICQDCLNEFNDDLNTDQQLLSYLYNLNKHLLVRKDEINNKLVFRMLINYLHEKTGILLNSVILLDKGVLL